MKYKIKMLSPFEEGNDIAVAEEKKRVSRNKETITIDPEQYKKHAFQKMDKRFWGIVLATFLLNTIFMIYLSNLPYEISGNTARRIQEHYANFIYQKQKKTLAVEASTTAKEGVGSKKEESKKVAEQPPAEAKSGGTSGGNRAKGPATAKERVAARSRSTSQISQEVSKKGLLGLLTGTGTTAQGEAVNDVLGNDAGKASGKNLDKILSNIGGIKTSGASEGVGKGGSGRARGSRASGAGAAIDDIVTGLGRAQTKSVQKTTKMKLFKSANVKAEAGKSGGRSAQSVLAIINSHKAAIEYCYQRALRTNPNLKGKISVRFVIHTDGSVGKVSVVESTLNNSGVERCIVSKIRRWRDFGPVDPSKGDAVFRQDYIFGY